MTSCVKIVLQQITNKGVITMAQIHFNTIEEVRKAGSHLSLEERSMIQALHSQGYSLRSIAAEVGCARANNIFQPEQIPCTKTLYNMLWAGRLPLSLFDVPMP